MVCRALRCVAFVGCFLISLNADAAPVLILDGSGHWMGATDVAVDGSDYDLAFIEGTCAAAFGACDQDHFTFATYLSALSAQHAIDTMAHDGAFENNPQLISTGVTGIVTPYALTAASLVTWTTFFHDRGAPDLENDHFSTTFDSVAYDVVWAVWTPVGDPPSVPVPEPSSSVLLVAGVSGLIATKLIRCGWDSRLSRETTFNE